MGPFKLFHFFAKNCDSQLIAKRKILIITFDQKKKFNRLLEKLIAEILVKNLLHLNKNKYYI